MKRIRSYFDSDRAEGSVPTKYKTKENGNPVICSICSENLFVDDGVFKEVGRAIEETEENPFLCEDCLNEYEESSHSQ